MRKNRATLREPAAAARVCRCRCSQRPAHVMSAHGTRSAKRDTASPGGRACCTPHESIRFPMPDVTVCQSLVPKLAQLHDSRSASVDGALCGFFPRSLTVCAVARVSPSPIAFVGLILSLSLTLSFYLPRLFALTIWSSLSPSRRFSTLVRRAQAVYCSGPSWCRSHWEGT